MYILKRIAAVITFIAVMLNVTLASAAQLFPQDVEGTPYEEAVKKLVAIKVFNYSEDGFFPEKEITRAEFTAIILRLCGYGDENFVVSENPVTSRFVDVRSDMWYAPYVDFAADIGIISGFNGYFEPDASVTFDEAIKILVSAMGYDYFAELNGGYPFGYIVTAKQIGILGDMKDGSAAIKRGEMAVLVNSALEADVLDERYFSSTGDISFERSQLAQSKLNIHDVRGIVTENSLTGITADSTLNYGKIRLDDNNVYLAGETNAEDFLGYSVDVTYKHDDSIGENVILYITKSKDNRELAVSAEDIVSSNTSVIEYREGNNIKKASLASDFDIIYNGKFISSFSNNMLNPDEGDITFVANKDSVSGYNMLFVNSLKNLVVNAVDPDNYKVYDKISPDITITLNHEDIDSKISLTNTSGEEKQFSDIKQGSIISAYISQDEKYIKAILNNERTEVAVTETFENGEGFYVVSGEKSFKLNKRYKEYLIDKRGGSQGNSGNSANIGVEFSVGESALLFLDVNGNVMWHESKASAEAQLAYLVDVDEGFGFDASVKIKIFTRNAKHEIYECAPRVRIDGYVRKNTASIVDLLKPNGKVNNMLIAYKLNEDGMVNYIDTKEKTDEEDDASLTMDITMYTSDHKKDTVNYPTDGANVSKTTYKASTKTIGFKILLNDGLPIFAVPATNPASANENYFSVKDISYFRNDGRYHVETYKMNPSSFGADAAILYEETASGGSIDQESLLSVVQKISTVSIDGESRQRITAIRDGKEITITGSEPDTFKNTSAGTRPNPAYDHQNPTNPANQGVPSTLPNIYRNMHPGDVFRYQNMPDGMVGKVQLIMATAGERDDESGPVDPSDKIFVASEDTNMMAQARFAERYVYDKNAGNIKVVKQSVVMTNIDPKNDNYNGAPLTDYEIHRASLHKIVVVEFVDGRALIRSGTVDDIIAYKVTRSEYSKILIHSRYGEARSIIVFK